MISAIHGQATKGREDGIPSGARGASVPHIEGILETALYVDDLERAERFYRDLFGFPQIGKAPGRHVFFRVGAGVLLLFRAEETQKGGTTPPHGATGAGHLAFAIGHGEYAAWKEHVTRHGIPIEQEVTWGSGGRSFYFRDPDGNSLELATPDTWPDA